VYPGGTIIEFLAPRNFTRTRGLSADSHVVIIDIALCIYSVYNNIILLSLCIPCTHIYTSPTMHNIIHYIHYSYTYAMSCNTNNNNIHYSRGARRVRV